jgi:hypothetical protein
MSSARSQTILSPESIHELWLQQRAELEKDLFDGWTAEAPAAELRTTASIDASGGSIPPQPADTPTTSPAAQSQDRKPIVNAQTPANREAPHSTPNPEVQPPAVATPKMTPERAAELARHAERLRKANDAALKQRLAHQQQVEAAMIQQRKAFLMDLARQRAAYEQEFNARHAAWVAQRDQEWESLKRAKEIHEQTVQRIKEELAAQRIREREELMQWRQKAEAELAEAYRVFEQERLRQQQEFAQARETEAQRLRFERDDLERRTRQAQLELANARQTQEAELQNLLDQHTRQMRAERAEIEKLRAFWHEKIRNEQAILERGRRFLDEQLRRLNEDWNVVPGESHAADEADHEPREVLSFSQAVSRLASNHERELPRTTQPSQPRSLEQISRHLDQLKASHQDAA